MVDIKTVIGIVVALAIAAFILLFAFRVITVGGGGQEQTAKVLGCQQCLQTLCAVPTNFGQPLSGDTTEPCKSTACKDVKGVSIICPG